jgi:hypothetical protein
VGVNIWFVADFMYRTLLNYTVTGISAVHLVQDTHSALLRLHDHKSLDETTVQVGGLALD